MTRTPRSRKITPAQLDRIREDARRNWGRAMEKIGPDAAPAFTKKPALRRKGR